MSEARRGHFGAASSWLVTLKRGAAPLPRHGSLLERGPLEGSHVAEELFVTDTHPLLWFAANQRRKLGSKARVAFDAYESGEASIYVPAPVIIECWMLARNGTLMLEGSLDKWWRSVQAPGLLPVELTPEDVIRAADLAWDHDDVFDRLIVATTQRLDVPLITKDGSITTWGGVEVRW